MYVEYKQGEKHKLGVNPDVSDDINAFRDCGYLLEKDDVIIDIDDPPIETIKAMLDWFNIKTKRVWTSRGVHLYFKKPVGFKRAQTHICQLGFKVEMKTSTNTPDGITVKRNGVTRTIENEGTVEELPDLFNDRKKYANLLGMGEADGRNNALFAHKAKLANCQGWENILNFINKYVFAVPLDDKEFETVARAQAFNSKDSNENTVANEIINEFRCVNYMNSIWWFNGTKYLSDPKDNRLIKIIYSRCPDVNTKFIDEVMKQIRYKSRLVNEISFPILFKNGVLDNVDGEFIETSDVYDFTPYYINIEYHPDAAPVEIVDEYIDNLTGKDPDYRKLLCEVLGYSLMTDPERIRAIGQFFMFRGDGRNGKGTLLQIIQTILNKENCTNMSIKQITDQRYSVTMIGKLANLGDDIEPEPINNDQMKVLKNLTTADDISTRHLYHEAETAQITTKLYFTTNSDIRSFEKGYAFKRRIKWLPMFNVVDKVDPRFISKITTKEALEYWVRLLVEGCQRLYEQGCWTECEKVNEYNRLYHEANNIMVMFLKDVDVTTDLIGKTIKEIEAIFNDWNDDETRKWNSKLFRQTVWEQYKAGMAMVKTAGKTSRVLTYQKDTDQNIVPR